MLARKRNYQAAVQRFEEATNSPGFNLKAAHQELNFGLTLLAVYLAQGNRDGYLETLTHLHEGIAETESPDLLYQLVELPGDLPPELEMRRKSCAQRDRLDRQRLNPDAKLADRDAELLGMLAYREGDCDTAIEVLQQPMQTAWYREPVMATAFSAMAHWENKEKDKARQLLVQADALFEERVAPGMGLYPPDVSDAIMMEMTIKEADELIDPGVDNAPHVAALPPVSF